MYYQDILTPSDTESPEIVCARSEVRDKSSQPQPSPGISLSFIISKPWPTLLSQWVMYTPYSYDTVRQIHTCTHLLLKECLKFRRECQGKSELKNERARLHGTASWTLPPIRILLFKNNNNKTKQREAGRRESKSQWVTPTTRVKARQGQRQERQQSPGWF